jgi:ParB-like chromosome segregation protein Spo0J
MIIEKRKLSELKPAEYNPRKDLKPADPEYQKLKKSIIEFDLVEPIIWNRRTGNIVGGHQRFKILEEMGVEETFVSVVDLDDAKEKALNVALNKISGAWDFPKLKDLLVEIDTGAFDIEVTGFDFKEIKGLLDFEKEQSAAPMLGSVKYSVVIECENEAHQIQMLERFEKEGFTCRAVIL